MRPVRVIPTSPDDSHLRSHSHPGRTRVSPMQRPALVDGPVLWPLGGFGRARSAVDSGLPRSCRGLPGAHRRYTFAETSKASSGGPKNCPEGNSEQFILLTAVREEAETPPSLVAEVPQPTQVHRRGTHSLHVLLTRLRQVRRRSVRTGRHRFRVCIDVAELRSKPDIQACITSSVMLVGIAAQACFRALPNQFGNGFPTTIRVESPCALPRHLQMIQSPGMVYTGSLQER